MSEQAVQALNACVGAFYAHRRAADASYGAMAAFATQLLGDYGRMASSGDLRRCLLLLISEKGVAVPAGWVEIWKAPGAHHVDKAVRAQANSFYHSLSKALTDARKKKDKLEAAAAPRAPSPAPRAPSPAPRAPSPAPLAPAPAPLAHAPAARLHLYRAAALAPPAPKVPDALLQHARQLKRPRPPQAIEDLQSLAQASLVLKHRLSVLVKEFLGRCVCSCGQEHTARSALDSLLAPAEMSAAALRAGPTLARGDVQIIAGLEMREVPGRGVGVFAIKEINLGAVVLSFDSFFAPGDFFHLPSATPYSLRVRLLGESGERHPYQCCLAARVNCASTPDAANLA
jgi:hypothetical protein